MLGGNGLLQQDVWAIQMIFNDRLIVAAVSSDLICLIVIMERKSIKM
jgi:hypothetical protein